MSSEGSASPAVATDPTEPEGCTLEEFFLQTPPGSLRAIKTESLSWNLMEGQRSRYATALPELKLHCSSDKCEGYFWFRPSNASYQENLLRLTIDEAENRFVRYICKSCESTRKIFAVWLRLPAEGKLLAYKFGEYPDYGPSLPARVLRLVQPDADLFKKGWKAEKMGFGICAFTYYRRIVENHKNELFDKFIEVAEEEHLATDKIDALRHARDHTQFSQSTEQLRRNRMQSRSVLGITKK